MSIFPEENFTHKCNINLAPMVDFLFLLLVIFSILAITRAALYDSDIQLVTSKVDHEKISVETPFLINISLSKEGDYKWISEVENYRLESIESLQKELINQYSAGLLPKDKGKIKVLLHIDKDTPWEYVVKGIFAIREVGFLIHPVYEPEVSQVKQCI